MVRKKKEGNEEQRRAKARAAKATGKRPSAAGATIGASKQPKKRARNDDYVEKTLQRSEGKQPLPKPRPIPKPGRRHGRADVEKLAMHRKDSRTRSR